MIRASTASPPIAALLFLCIAAGLFFPPPAQARSGGRVVIEYWEKWTGFELDAMRAIVGDFNRSQDRIEVRLLPVVNIDIKLLLATSGGNPPDIAGLWSFSVPDFSEKGALTPLDGAIARHGPEPSHYVPVFRELCRHRGFTWALPVAPSCTALFLNRAEFRAAGLDPRRPPRSIAELDAMNRKLTLVEIMREGWRVRVPYEALTDAERRDTGAFRIVRAGHIPQEPDTFIELWGYWFGAAFYDGRRVTADHPGNLAAFEWLRGVSLRYGAQNLDELRASFGNKASAQNAFLSGGVAMVLDGTWWPNFIKNYAPALDWDAAAFPPAQGDRGKAHPVTIVECDVLVIPRAAKHPREAFEFIRYVQRREVAEKLARAQRKFTALAGVSPGFSENHPNPRIDLFIELSRSPGARAVPRLPFWLEYRSEMRAAAESVIALRTEPAAALETVQRRVQKIMDRWSRRWDAVGEARMEEWREYADKW